MPLERRHTPAYGLPIRRHQLTQRRRQHLARPPEPEPEQERQRRTVNWTAITSIITAITAVGALIFTALSLNATRDQVAVTEQGQYTDRYSRAIEQLGRQGPDQLQIRLGGIYSLERLARDSPRDQATIVEVLNTFIRTSVPSVTPTEGCPTSTPPDVQAALTVLGRRDTTNDNGTPVKLMSICLVFADLTVANLSDADLSGADLSGANFSSADLSGTDLSGTELNNANVNNADLSHADLTGANLSYSYLNNANLSGANLNNANFNNANLNNTELNDTELSGADLNDTDLNFAELNNANLTKVNLSGADLSFANLTGANLTGAVHNSDTVVANVLTDRTTRGHWW